MIPRMRDENLLVGMEVPDDAGVYKINDELALIQTLDFFTPIVDDPYTFGLIAVTNSLSDVYAMGGTPKLAMNIICFPSSSMDISILEEVIKGGADKMTEAGVLLVGGHSVDDPELKYGLSVTGFVRPDKVLMKKGCRPSDKIILTKPLGIGIISTAIKAGMASSTATTKAVKSMSTLNNIAGRLMEKYDVSACTDITGFGLLGHTCEMIEGTQAGMTIYASRVPVIDEAREYACLGLIPAGAYRNEDFRKDMVINDGVDDTMMKLLFDPQTSGGLLVALPQNQAHALLNELRNNGISEASIIGEITESPKGQIIIKP